MSRLRLYLPIAVAAALGFGVVWASRAFPPVPPASTTKPPLARLGGPAPAARVPAPKPVDPATLKLACWGCPEASTWPVRFRTDLDLLAPLGDGPANAALWLADFSRNPKGARLDEFEDVQKRLVTRTDGRILPGDDKFLREAEPWADQAAMRFYPDVFAYDGFSTPIPNLFVAITLARSWVARARSNADAPLALEDARRAIRWGRLLRQDDVTIIQDLIGLACIRMGVDTLYDLAQRRGDLSLMLAAAAAAGEQAAQRHRTSLFMNSGVFPPRDGPERWVAPTDKAVEKLAHVAAKDPDRRFRLEAIVQLAAIRFRGTSAQRAVAGEALDGILRAPATDADGAQARWARRAAWSQVAAGLE